MAPVLWVLAALSTITVIHRIRYTYDQTKHLAPLKPGEPMPSPNRAPETTAAHAAVTTPNA